MEKLISMREKVLQLESQLKRCISEGMPFTDLQSLKQSIQTQIFLFANFLSQKLELWMFVPCKLVYGVWIPLDESNKFLSCEKGSEYGEAKDRVLFEGKIDVSKQGSPAVRFNNIMCIISYWTIEDLVKYNLVLTETAKKQIRL